MSETGNFEQQSIVEHEKTGYGKSVELRAVFQRHFDPKVNPETGMSMDELTDTGRDQAAEMGSHLEGKVKAHASPKKRAQESIGIALENVSGNVEIINKQLEEKRNGLAFNVGVRKELDVTNVGPLWQEAGKVADAAIQAGQLEKGKKLDFQTQYLLDHPERAKELGVQSAHEIAQSTAYRLERIMQMPSKLYDKSEVTLINITHGPKLEPFLKEVLLRQQDGKTIKGFDTVEEIGGAFKPGENFEVVIKTDENGNESFALNVRGTTYDIDTEAVSLLAGEYRTILAEKKKKSEEAKKKE